MNNNNIVQFRFSLGLGSTAIRSLPFEFLTYLTMSVCNIILLEVEFSAKTSLYNIEFLKIAFVFYQFSLAALVSFGPSICPSLQLISKIVSVS